MEFRVPKRIKVEAVITLPDGSQRRVTFEPFEPVWEGILCERLIFDEAVSLEHAFSQMQLAEQQKSVRDHYLRPFFAGVCRAMSDIAAERTLKRP